MRSEDLKREFPEMPEEIRIMIGQEVQKQMRAGAKSSGRRKKRTRRAAAALIAATMLLGTTAFAGIFYRMRSERVGSYAMRATIEADKSLGLEGAAQDQAIQDIRMEVSYLPEGMVESEDGKYCYADNMYKGGVSIVFYRMDQGDAQFDMLIRNVAESEQIRIGGYDGLYLRLSGAGTGEIFFDQRVYVAYTDLHYVMEMYVASDVTKEDALKIAEGIRLQPVSDEKTQKIVQAYRWSEYLESQDQQEAAAGAETGAAAAVPASALANAHKVGEAFAAAPAGEDDWQGLADVAVRVADIQVCDDVSLLDPSVMDSDDRAALAGETDQDGRLRPVRIDYIRYGDGIDTADEIVASREVAQKLVYVTVEYTNAGTDEISELLFFGNLLKLTEEDGQIRLYDGRAAGPDLVWDEAVPAGAARHAEMWYYDVHGGERHNNYIEHLKAGETAVVHMAWIVPEEELGYLYLDLDASGSAYEISERSMETGFVDIRR